MARPRVPEADRSTPFMISLPRRLQEALKHLARNSALRGGPDTVSGIIRELVEARIAETGDDVAPAVFAVPEFQGGSGPRAPEALRSLAASAPAMKTPSQLTREEREEHMRRMDPEGYRKMREAYEAALAEGD